MTFVHLNVLIPFQAYGECSTGHYDQTFVFNKVSKLGRLLAYGIQVGSVDRGNAAGLCNLQPPLLVLISAR